MLIPTFHEGFLTHWQEITEVENKISDINVIYTTNVFINEIYLLTSILMYKSLNKIFQDSPSK